MKRRAPAYDERKVTVARACALEALAAAREGAPADEALDAAWALRPGISAADKALAMELAYGVLRWRRRLDDALAPHCRKGLPKPPLLDVLRVAAYSLLFLDVPAHATVSTAVEAARATKGGEAAAKFANAVLRALSADAARLRAEPPPPPGARRTELARWYSFPDWMVEALAEVAGDALPALLAASNERAPLALRAPEGRQRELVEALAAHGARAGRHATDAVVIERPSGPVSALPGFAEGRFAVQDEGAQLVTELLGPIAGVDLLDVCAAPGGKALHAAQLGARVVAVDADARRLERVVESATRLRVRGSVTTIAAVAGADGIPSPLLEGRAFARVLVDAPCSGTGILRRKPDAKWARAPHEIDALAKRQRAILEGAAKHLAPGGRLVYAVCSLLRAEGEGVVEPFLAAHPALAVVAPPPSFADGRFFRCRPDLHGTDGFFAAILEKRPASGAPERAATTH